MKRFFLLSILLLSITVLRAQNVGIGTDNPQAKLHVAGSVRVDSLAGTGVRPVYADSMGQLFSNVPALPPSTVTNDSSIAIPDYSCAGATSTITLSGLPTSVASASIEVIVNITHPHLADLTIYLTTPGERIINLFYNTSSAADLVEVGFSDDGIPFDPSLYNYSDTFYQAAGDLTPSPCGITPTDTTFSELGYGIINPNGTWTLKVIDNTTGQTGTLNHWTISVNPGIGQSGMWNLQGNAGLNNSNFVGTTDNVPLHLKVHSQNAGIIDSLSQNTAFGYRALDLVTVLGKSNTALGYKTLAQNTSGSKNSAFGVSSLNYNTTGYENTANGYQALYHNTTGYRNLASGYQALRSNTIGSYNIAIGRQSLFYNDSGSHNTAIGVEALYYSNGNYNMATGEKALKYNSTGSFNTAYGYRALNYNDIGYGNTAIGPDALASNSSGYANTAIGLTALDQNTTGSWNTAVGDSALLQNSEGNFNTAIGGWALTYTVSGGNTASGFAALHNNIGGAGNTTSGAWSLFSNTSGYDNVAVGNVALYYNNTGYRNTATGYDALYYNNTGYYNTASGYAALYLNSTGHYNTAIGVEALYSTNENRNTGMGFQAMYNNDSGYENTAAGYEALYSNISGYRNIAIGDESLYSVTTGNSNTALGYGADVNAGDRTNSTALGYNAYADDNDKVRVGDTNVQSIQGHVDWTADSDARIKDDVQENVPGLDFILKLRPVTYHLNSAKQNAILGITDTLEWEGKHDIEKMQFSGFLAQDVEAAAKKIGYDFSGVDKSGKLLGLRYGTFVVPLVKAVQEQQDIIDALRQESTKQASTIDALQQQVQALLSTQEKMQQEIQSLKAQMGQPLRQDEGTANQ